ncbi:carboxypeptidase-like regulatory domain-containing protein [Pedobacter panaciterrae]
MVYPGEEEFLIKGKVTNAFNKPVAKSAITLFSKNPLLVLESITDDNGNFIFKGIAPIDTPAYFISAKNKRGKSFNVGIEMDEFKAPVFSPITNSIVPWFVNIDTGTYLAVNNRVALKKNNCVLPEVICLKR